MPRSAVTVAGNSYPVVYDCMYHKWILRYDCESTRTVAPSFLPHIRWGSWFSQRGTRGSRERNHHEVTHDIPGEYDDIPVTTRGTSRRLWFRYPMGSAVEYHENERHGIPLWPVEEFHRKPKCAIYCRGSWVFPGLYQGRRCPNALVLHATSPAESNTKNLRISTGSIARGRLGRSARVQRDAEHMQ